MSNTTGKTHRTKWHKAPSIQGFRGVSRAAGQIRAPRLTAHELAAVAALDHVFPVSNLATLGADLVIGKASAQNLVSALRCDRARARKEAD